MKTKFLAFVLITAGILAGCKKKSDNTVVDVAAVDKAAKQEVVNNYAQIVYLSYLDSYNAALGFQTKVEAFLEAPTEVGLEGLKTEWLAIRKPYLQTEAYRFAKGPIDSVDPNVEGDLNSWPVDEAFIDYVVKKDGVTKDFTAGVINIADAKYATLTEDLIQSLNGQGGDANISAGYHAIEFLLWGQDLYADSPGKRLYTDYTSQTNFARRKTYLSKVTSLMVKELGLLPDQWKPNSISANYRTQFVGQDPNISLALLISGIWNFTSGELPFQRIQTALDNQNQEDEHSCFSDNTHNDIRYDVLGVDNVFYGRYTAANGTIYDGKGINELIKAKDETAYNTIVANFADAINNANAIQPPFDQEIIGTDASPGRIRVKATVDAILKENKSINDAAKLLGITILVVNK